MKRTKGKKLVCLGLVIALLLTTFTPMASMEANAAKKVTSKYSYSKAPTVKTGTTTVTAKPIVTYKENGKYNTKYSWAKFKAPKPGTYQFTVSDYSVKGNKKQVVFGSVLLWTGKTPKTTLNVKTKGGKYYALYMCSSSANSASGKVKTTSFIKKRTGTVKLKKGQIVYFEFVNRETVTFKLNIKRK